MCECVGGWVGGWVGGGWGWGGAVVAAPTTTAPLRSRPAGTNYGPAAVNQSVMASKLPVTVPPLQLATAPLQLPPRCSWPRPRCNCHPAAVAPCCSQSVTGPPAAANQERPGRHSTHPQSPRAHGSGRTAGRSAAAAPPASGFPPGGAVRRCGTSGRTAARRPGSRRSRAPAAGGCAWGGRGARRWNGGAGRGGSCPGCAHLPGLPPGRCAARHVAPAVRRRCAGRPAHLAQDDRPPRPAPFSQHVVLSVCAGR